MSTLYVDNLQPNLGSQVEIPDLKPLAGSVMQVKQTVSTSKDSVNSTTFVEFSGLTTSITPSSESSKILVEVNINISSNGHHDLKLQSNGTDILVGDAAGSRIRSSYHGYKDTGNNGIYDMQSVSLKYLHSPNTTSPVTYKVFGAGPYSSSIYVFANSTYNDTDASYSGRTASTMTLTEIAG